MKKLLLLALLAVMMAGCGVSEKRNEELCNDNYSVVVIDSCEYLACDRLYDLSHKGNCRFCAERRNKEINKIIEHLKKN